MAVLSRNYKLSSGGSGNYLKIADGETVKIRITSDILIGYEVWTDNKEVLRQELPFSSSQLPLNIQGKPREFWACSVLNYSKSSHEVWVFHQRTIKELLLSYLHDEDWGEPKDYDLKVSRSGNGLDTKWSIIAGNKKPLDAKFVAIVDATKIYLANLYGQGDPFLPPVENLEF